MSGRPPFPKPAVVATLAACAAAAACSSPLEKQVRHEDVLLLLTIDTMRADRLGAGGDPEAHTPFLDRLARGGAQFATALANVPLTLPSHASILSGRIPPEHGARDNGLFCVREGIPLLQEVLQQGRWKTAAFLAAYPLARRFGLARGFGAYHDAAGERASGSPSPFAERSAGAVNEDLFDWLASEAPSGPLFLWVHYFDPHAPYRPPRPLGKIAGGDRYRGEIAFADRSAGRLLRRLARRFGRLRVCVTSDHGESLGEHGEETHGVFVYEATTRVPLILAGPGAPGGHLEREPVPLTALAPTLCAWAGLGTAGEEFPEEPLPGFGPPPAGAGGREPIYVESMYPALRHGWAPLQALRSERWKAVHAPIPELYDLRKDPREKDNLLRRGEPPQEAAQLLARLEESRFRYRLPEPGPPDPEVEEILASLGYASLKRGGPRPRAGEGADPKERIRIERLLGIAAGALEAENLAAARGAISSALSVDPRNKEARILQARCEAARGFPEQALEILEGCLALPPASADPLVHYEAGKVCLDAGWPARAERRFGQAVAGDPLNVDARFNWGVAAYRLGRYAQAARRWREVLRLDPDHRRALRWLPQAEERAREEASP